MGCGFGGWWVRAPGPPGQGPGLVYFWRHRRRAWGGPGVGATNTRHRPGPHPCAPDPLPHRRRPPARWPCSCPLRPARWGRWVGVGAALPLPYRRRPRPWPVPLPPVAPTGRWVGGGSATHPASPTDGPPGSPASCSTAGGLPAAPRRGRGPPARAPGHGGLGAGCPGGGRLSARLSTCSTAGHRVPVSPCPRVPAPPGRPVGGPHLRDGHYKGAEKLGHAQGYRAATGADTRADERRPPAPGRGPSADRPGPGPPGPVRMAPRPPALGPAPSSPVLGLGQGSPTPGPPAPARPPVPPCRGPSTVHWPPVLPPAGSRGGAHGFGEGRGGGKCRDRSPGRRLGSTA